MKKSAKVVLTEEMIKRRVNDDLGDIKKLNMWGFDLSDISIIEKFRTLEEVSFSFNLIENLMPFSKCKNICSLSLKHNLISDYQQLQYLTKLQKLKNLWLAENPISSDPLYRLKVIKGLPNLKQLDDQDISEAERNKAFSMNNEDNASIILPEIKSETKHQLPSKRILQLSKVKVEKKENDESLMIAIQALLPELSNESLDQVISRIIELKK